MVNKHFKTVTGSSTYNQKASPSFLLSGTEEAAPSESVTEEGNTTAAKVSNGPACGLLEHSSQLIELLSDLPSVVELLSQAAQSILDEQEKQVRIGKTPTSTSALEETDQICCRRDTKIFDTTFFYNTC